MGDSYVDVLTAKNAGIEGVMLTWGFDSKEHLVEVGAKHLVNDAGELYDIVLRLFENKVTNQQNLQLEKICFQRNLRIE